MNFISKQLISKSLILSALILICQGCSSTVCNLNPDCKDKKTNIIRKIEKCNKLENGYDINSDLNKYYYDKYVKDEKYRNTTKTYGDVKEECQSKYLNAIKKQQELKKKQEEAKLQAERNFKANEALAKKAGYKGYAEFNAVEDFIGLAQHGSININDYKDYILWFESTGSYAYTFTQLVNNAEVYQPNYRYGLKSTLGIQRAREQRNQPIEGQPLQNAEYLSFKGIKTYKTVLGANRQILMFDRALDFKVFIVQEVLKKLEESQKDK